MVRVYTPEGEREPGEVSLAPLRQPHPGFRLALAENGKDNALALMEGIARRVAAEQGWPEPLTIRKAHSSVPLQPDELGALRREFDLVLTGSAD